MYLANPHHIGECILLSDLDDLAKSAAHMGR
jgi:hypothetical protein